MQGRKAESRGGGGRFFNLRAFFPTRGCRPEGLKIRVVVIRTRGAKVRGQCRVGAGWVQSRLNT